LAAGATAAVVARLQRIGRVASLYVNAYNQPARATYRKVGFTQVGCFATVLF
ncbi:MAG: GNAT family N-acetyltransferase, partial [Pseudonocardiaceae bacterium]